MVLETHVGGFDSSVYGGLQGMHLEVESNLNKSGGMEALRERKVCAATGIVSMRAACSPFFRAGRCPRGRHSGGLASAVRSPQRSETEDMAHGMWPQKQRC